MPATNRAAALAYLAIALTGLAGCKGNGDDDPETTATVPAPAQGSADPRVVKRIPLKSTTEQVVAQIGRPARIEPVKAKGRGPGADLLHLPRDGGRAGRPDQTLLRRRRASQRTHRDQEAMNDIRQMLRLAALVACCVLFGAPAISGCGGGDDGPTDLPPLEEEGTNLDAGEYRTTKFKPRTLFEVGEGWGTASDEVIDYFDIVRAEDSFEAIAFQRVAQVAPPKSPDSPVPAPNNLVGWIRDNPRLEAGAPTKTIVNGKLATQIDAVVKKAAPRNQRPPSCETPCLPLFHPSDNQPVSYEPGDRLRFVIVPVRGEVPITITIAATDKDFKSFLPEAEEVLSTVEFADS